MYENTVNFMAVERVVFGPGKGSPISTNVVVVVVLGVVAISFSKY